MFRLLTAEEVECRVAHVNQYKDECTLLLYKDARCDMNILDATVGPMNWQREHVLIDGQLFCKVGIREEHENYVTGFVWKEDVGTESNTEAEKGRASDSFKRACFNWGIGRELYTAPQIVVPCKREERNSKWITYDKFKVESIDYDENRKINKLVITKDGAKVFDMNEEPETISVTHIKALRSLMKKKDVPEEKVVERYGELELMTFEKYESAVRDLEAS